MKILSRRRAAWSGSRTIIAIGGSPEAKEPFGTTYWSLESETRSAELTNFEFGGRGNRAMPIGILKTEEILAIPGGVSEYIIFGMRRLSKW